MLTAGIAGGQVERFWNALPWMYLSAIVVAATVGWLHSRRALVLSAIVIALGSVALEHAGWLWGAAGPRAAGWPPRFLHHAVWVLTVPDLLTVTLAIAGVVGLAVRAFDRDRSLRAPPAPPAMAPVALLLLAVMTGPLVRDLPRISSTIRHGSAEQGPANLISPGAVSYLNHHTRTPFPVVLAPWDGPADGLAYQIVGKSNVYTVALNEPHTRATPRDHPTQRRAEVTTFFAPGTSEQVRQAILHNQNVDYVVFDERSGSPERAGATASRPDAQRGVLRSRRHTTSVRSRGDLRTRAVAASFPHGGGRHQVAHRDTGDDHAASHGLEERDAFTQDRRGHQDAHERLEIHVQRRARRAD